VVASSTIGPMANIFDVQSDIAVRVTRALQASAGAGGTSAHRAAGDREQRRVRALSAGSGVCHSASPSRISKASTACRRRSRSIRSSRSPTPVLAQRQAFKGAIYGRAESLRAIEAGRQACASIRNSRAATMGWPTR
jgi:hypothetical protein